MAGNEITQRLVHKTADEFRQAMIDIGVKCGPIDHSINRHGEASSYFRALRTTFRISDHDANEAFRVNEVSILVRNATAAEARRIASEFRRRDKLNAVEQCRELKKRDAFEAPFKARFLAAKEHEQHGILCEAYPAAARDVHLRRAVRARWIA